MDVAAELNVPSYIFYASNSALLNLGLYFQHMKDDHGVDVTQVADQDAELDLPGLGSFPEDQVREIAKALEGTSYRFLWSLRRPAKPEEKLRIAVDQEDPATILPDGFLDRTADRGRIIG
ncbi:UDP-glycosyltransferase 71A15-like protein [Drosera capensis]